MSDDLLNDVLERALRAQERTAAAYEEARINWQAERRERIATAALQGLLAWPGNPTFIDGPYKGWALHAVEYADALIAELDRENGR